LGKKGGRRAGLYCETYPRMGQTNQEERKKRYVETREGFSFKLGAGKAKRQITV